MPRRLAQSMVTALVTAFALLLLAAQGAFAAPLPEASPESVGLSSQRLALIGPAFQRAVDEGAFPGAVVMVARRGKLVYRTTVGALKPDGPKMSEDAIFRIYSMTKPLVSVAAMTLVEDGVIELTDPVSKYLPGWDKMMVSETVEVVEGRTAFQMVPAKRPITVQDLLRHTSGLVYGGMTANAPVNDGLEEAGVYNKQVAGDSRNMTPAQQVERMARVPLVWQPGTRWQYGLSVDILGRVVEVATGQRLADYLRKRVLEPLGLRDTGFWVDRAQLGRVAEPFPVRPALIDVSIVPGNDSGGAGGVSTAADYLRFSQMLLNGGTLDGQRILGPNTVKLMTSDHLGDFIENRYGPGELLLKVEGYTFGLGFAVREADGLAAVPGSKGDFTWAGYAGTYFWVDPTEQLVGVFMTQGPSPNRSYYRRLMRQLVYGAIEK